MLTVTGLEPGVYEVYIDGVLSETLDSSELH